MKQLKRFDPATGSAFMTLAVVVVVGLLLSLGTIFPPGTRVSTSASADGPADDSSLVPGGEGAGSADGALEANGPGVAGGARGADGRAGPSAAKPGQACEAGRNGGTTDVGVTGDTIKVASTVVTDGPGASFLAPVRIAMNAVVNEANAAGICGRRIKLLLRNDSWDGPRGKQFIQNFVESEKVFALTVVPSSEGLHSAKEYITQQKVPVVGTDGMLIHQYRNPWIWPVATSTISTMHIMAKNAHDRGATEFGLVFDAEYHFGVEGAYAFNQAVKRMTGKDIPGYDPSLKSCNQRFCGIQPGNPSYSNEAHRFNGACGMEADVSATRCHFIGVLLEPDTALSWFSVGSQGRPTIGYGGAQPLFTRDFAEKCRAACNGMWVWTGYNPPIEQYAGAGPVRRYVDTVRKESSSVDVNNQFVQGGYLGMSLFVEAAKKVGPNLTRENLRSVLDGMTLDSGLSMPLTWRPGNHFANSAAQAFEIQYGQNFTGWRSKTALLTDPWLGQDIPAGE